MTALKIYANGAVPSSQMFLHDGVYLRRAVAVALSHAEQAAAKQGVKIAVLQVKNRAAGHRTLAVAEDLRAHPAAYNVNPHVKLAPAHEDSHLQGMAFDVVPGAGLNWLKTHGAHYRLYTGTIPNDPNHVVYR